ncbi:MAG: GatB/YqeY domain-containing protein [Shimia sp.]
MEMREKVSAALKAAMKAKDTERLGTLRLINAAIKDRDIALRGADGEGQCQSADITAILAKMVKQRRESAAAYEEGGRFELAEKELEEIGVIEEFLPRQLTQAETDSAIDEAVAETGAASIRDMGKVMGALKSRYAGRMDFAAAGPKVKERLAG